MKTVIFLSCIALVYGASLPPTWDERVVGGSDATEGQFPYQVSLRTTSNGHFCGGSIITKYTVLTAAHCVSGKAPDTFVVIVGTIYLNKGGYTYKVKSSFTHEKYDAKQVLNDIAVVIVTQAITFTSTIQPIGLPTSSTGANEKLTLSGWGLTSYPGDVPNTLQTINLNSISVADCKSALPNTILDSQLCTLNQKGEGACYGDSGGPLVRDGKQVGVVSWGYPCATGKPDVFTRVSSFSTWVGANKVG